MKRRRTSGPSYSQLRSALVIEKKYYDYPFPNNAAGTTVNQQRTDIGEFTNTALVKCPLLDLTQGTNENQRVGRKIAIHSFHMYGTIRVDPANSSTPPNPDQWIRAIIFIDTQNNGVTTTNISELLDTQVASTQSIFYFRDLTRGSRFRVLKDEYLHFKSDTVIDSSVSQFHVVPDTKFIEYHKTFSPPLKIEYNGTNGAGSELTQNNLYVAFMKQNTGKDCFLEGVCRIRYTD